MREIKFRAWNKKEEHMSQVQGLEWENGVLWVGLDPLPLNQVGKNCVLMQYTGLKDRNGKEIYEGDLVSVPEDGWANWTNRHNARVVFERGAFITDYTGQRVTERLEVIGNIYENPELL